MNLASQIRFPCNRSERRSEKARNLSDITNVLIVLLWLAPTIRYRVEMGSFSFALMEPIALFVVFFLLVRAMNLRDRMAISSDPVTVLLTVLVMWVAIIRPWGQDWQHRLSDVRDWAVPVLTYVVLVSTIRRGWRKWALFFVLVGVISAVVGIYQHITDSFRPFASAGTIYKHGYFLTDGSSLPQPSIAIALFEHPNSLAMYLIIALLITLGWLEERGNRLAKVTSVVFLAGALLWTYAKAQVLTMAIIFLLFWLSRRIGSVRLYVACVAGVFGLTGVAFRLAMRQFPVAFGTFWWRVDLWQTALETIGYRPLTLLVGNGDTVFAANAIWPQPHSLYLNFVLKYGLPGLGLLLALGFILAKYGFLAYRGGWLRQYPVLRAVWIALLAFFITGFVESALIGIETRMIFLSVVACFIGLRREVRAEAKNSLGQAFSQQDRGKGS